MISALVDFLLGLFFLFGPPALAVYSWKKRKRTMEENRTGYIYNGKMWVKWLVYSFSYIVSEK